MVTPFSTAVSTFLLDFAAAGLLVVTKFLVCSAALTATGFGFADAGAVFAATGLAAAAGFAGTGLATFLTGLAGTAFLAGAFAAARAGALAAFATFFAGA